MSGQGSWLQRTLHLDLPPSGEMAVRLVLGVTRFALGEHSAAVGPLQRVMALSDMGAGAGTNPMFSAAREAAEGYLALIAHLRGQDASATWILEQARLPEDLTRRERNPSSSRAGLSAFVGIPAPHKQAHERLRGLASRLEYPMLALHAGVVNAWAAAKLSPAAEKLSHDLAGGKVCGLGWVLFQPTYSVLSAEVAVEAGDLAALGWRWRDRGADPHLRRGRP
jgi:hypothetical protein